MGATYRCVRCAREYREDVPPNCVVCTRPLERLVDQWAGHQLAHGPRKVQVVGPMQIRARRHRSRAAGPVVSQVFGGEVPGSLWLAVFGLPSAGKSTWVTRAAEDGTWERPLVIVAEEGLDSAGLASRVERLEVTRSRFADARSLPEVADVVEAEQPDLVVLDSVTALGLDPGDVVALRRSWPETSWVTVIQSTKDGGHRGSQGWIHDADAALRLEPGAYAVTKCWFAALSEGRFDSEEVA